MLPDPNSLRKSIKKKLYHFLTKTGSVVMVLFIAIILSMADRNYGFFFGLGIVFFIAWQKNWDWSVFGFGKKITLQTVVKGMVMTIPLFIVSGIIEPFLQEYYGKFNLSSVDHIRGDFGNYVVLMIIMWIFAAFGEELLFRGYYMTQFAKLFGGTNTAWLLAGLFISIYFGISHGYQGTAGILSVAISSMYFSIIYFLHRKNVALAALVHGYYDTLGLTLIYLNKDGIFSEWVMKILAGD